MHSSTSGSEMRHANRLERLLVSALFLAFLCAPALEAWVDLDATPRISENRAPAPAPAWPRTRRELLELSRTVDAYVDDHFGFRDRLLYWNNAFKAAVLGVASTPNVILG